MMLPWSSLLSGAAALVAVLCLILLAARIARWRGAATRGGLPRRLVLLETAAVDPRRRLHLYACDGRRLLILTGGGNDLLLGWLDAPEVSH